MSEAVLTGIAVAALIVFAAVVLIWFLRPGG